MWPFSQLNAFLDLGMIVYTADRVARLSIGQDVGNDAGAALLAPLAALPVHRKMSLLINTYYYFKNYD